MWLARPPFWDENPGIPSISTFQEVTPPPPQCPGFCTWDAGMHTEVAGRGVGVGWSSHAGVLMESGFRKREWPFRLVVYNGSLWPFQVL